jgi:hypothetical protein
VKNAVVSGMQTGMKRPEIFLRYNPTAMIQHPDRFSHFEKRCGEREMRTSYNVPKLF